MQTFTTHLVSKETVARDTFSLHFEKPAGFTYQAGQFVKIAVPNTPPEDPKKGTRSMSLSSAPSENVLTFTMRAGISPFKKTTAQLQPGQPVIISEARGRLIIHVDASRPAVFLAGGVGITTFYSIIKEEIARNLPHEIFLFYADKDEASMCFSAKLSSLKNPRFHYIPTFTRLPEDHIWTGERGRISMELIRKHLPSDLNPVYYIVGATAMVIDSKKMLNAGGIKDADILFELFTGY